MHSLKIQHVEGSDPAQFQVTRPDGKSVAIRWNRWEQGKNLSGLWLISLEDSSQTLLHRGRFHPIEWSADGKWIYAYNPVQKPIKILKIPASDGDPKALVTLPFDNVNGISMTPDGRGIVCAVIETQSDVWLMENFDPEVK